MANQNKENEFYVCLLSNSSINYFNQNTLSSFTNLLASPINLTGDWAVGVTEVAFNSFIDNNNKQQIENNNNNLKRVKRSSTLKTQDGQSDTHLKITSELNHTTKANLPKALAPTMFIPKALSPIPEPKKNIDAINHTPDLNKKKLSIPIINETDGDGEKELVMNMDTVYSPTHEAIPFGYYKTNDDIQNSIMNTQKVDQLRFIYIYTDIINPRYIGGIKSRYLRIIPKSKNNESIIKFDHIEYCLLENNYLENISILIMDGQGEQINFESSASPTYIMLHFKRL